MKEQEDDIYLIDMARTLIRQWRWFAAVLAAVLVLTFAFVSVSKPQWEATAWIQVGEFGPTPAGRDPKIEPFQRTIERLQTRGFQDDVLASLGLPLNGRSAALYRKSLKLSPDPYANLIELKVRADSPQMARKLVMGTADRLREIHRGLGAQAVALTQARLQTIRSELASTMAERERWLRQVNGEGAPAGRTDGEGRMVAGMLLSEKDGVIRGLKAEIDDLTVRLTPRYTYETSLPWPIHLPDRPVSPNPVLAWGVGVLLGGALGVGVAVGVDAWGRRRVLRVV
jgi:hypothetical protein